MAEHDYEALPNNASFQTHLLAGALAGICEHSVMFPVDAIKTRMQVMSIHGANLIHSAGGATAVMTPETGAVRSIFADFTASVNARGLWRGVNTMIAGAGPSHALYFATYEHCKTAFGSVAEDDKHYHLANAAAGACATTASDAFMNPFDVIKQRMQVAGGSYRSAIHCLTSVIRTEGFGALYISLPTTLLMGVPFQAVQFSTYEYFRKVLNPGGDYSPVIHITSGGIAGATAAAVTTPLDAVKTLLQTRGMAATSSEARTAQGIFGAVRVIFQQAGWRGFMRGLAPRVATHAPSTAICWGVYEYFKWFLDKRERPHIEALDMEQRESHYH